MKATRSTLGVLCATLFASAAPHAGNITVKGSDTMVILAQKWAERYMGGHPEVKIQVTGGGSGTGFAALQHNMTDLATVSRKIKPKETEACIKAFGKRATEYAVALDGLCVYVNASNPLDQLSLEELRGIFTGKITNWRDLGGGDSRIVVYSRENSSGTYEFFKDHVLNGQDFLASAQTMPGTAAVLQAVGKDAQGIGYGGAAYGAGAKHLKISRQKGGAPVDPTEETVLNGTYPIWRQLFIYVNPALDKNEVGAYLKWIRSEDGQSVVREVGYYPLPATAAQLAAP